MVFKNNCTSTTHAILEIVATSLDDVHLFTELVFLSSLKAFDAVFHNILLNKPEHYDFRGSANLLLRSKIKTIYFYP